LIYNFYYTANKRITKREFWFKTINLSLWKGASNTLKETRNGCLSKFTS